MTGHLYPSTLRMPPSGTPSDSTTSKPSGLVELHEDAGQFAPKGGQECSQDCPSDTINPKEIEAIVDDLIGCHNLSSGAGLRHSQPRCCYDTRGLRHSQCLF